MDKKRRTKKSEGLMTSVPAFADQLGISPTTLYRAIEDGRLPALKIGSRYLLAKDLCTKLLREAGVEAEG